MRDAIAIALTQLVVAIDLSYAPLAAMVGWCRTFQRLHRRLPVIAGRYEKAIEWADRSSRELTRYESALRNRWQPVRISVASGRRVRGLSGCVSSEGWHV